MYDYPAPEFECPDKDDADTLAEIIPPDEDMTSEQAIEMDNFAVRTLKSAGYCQDAAAELGTE